MTHMANAIQKILKRNLALSMLHDGATAEEVAEHTERVGVPMTVGAVKGILKKESAKAITPDGARAIEMDRLDMMEAFQWEMLERALAEVDQETVQLIHAIPDYGDKDDDAVREKKVVLVGKNITKSKRYDQVRYWYDHITKTQAARRKMLGTDAPKKLEVKQDIRELREVKLIAGVDMAAWKQIKSGDKEIEDVIEGEFESEARDNNDSAGGKQDVKDNTGDAAS